MHVHLYRPLLWRSGGVLRVIHAAADLSPYDIAALIRLKRATLLPSPHPYSGDLMSDDYSSSLRLVTAPITEPVTLTQAKAFMRVEHTADDVAITTAITAARQSAEHYLRFLLLPQTWEYSVANPSDNTLRLPVGPAQSIASITLLNEAGTSSTMNAANYRLSVSGFSVLFVNAPLIEKLTVQYSASSYANVAAIPAMIVQGILHHVAVMMENRDGAVALPVQSIACYQPYRRVAL